MLALSRGMPLFDELNATLHGFKGCKKFNGFRESCSKGSENRGFPGTGIGSADMSFVAGARSHEDLIVWQVASDLNWALTRSLTVVRLGGIGNCAHNSAAPAPLRHGTSPRGLAGTCRSRLSNPSGSRTANCVRFRRPFATVAIAVTSRETRGFRSTASRCARRKRSLDSSPTFRNQASRRFRSTNAPLLPLNKTH